VVPVAHRTEVVILQHPLEVLQAKGSARLLHLCLPGSRLVVGEVFSVAELSELLTGAWPMHASSGSTRRASPPVLLYPETPVPESPAPAEPQSAVLAAAAQSDEPLRLIVLDATWRKSRKMLHQNPLLQTLPRLVLQGQPPSQYRIRKAHKPDQLSTLEATVAALVQLEGDAARFEPLLGAFDAFVEAQLVFMLA